LGVGPAFYPRVEHLRGTDVNRKNIIMKTIIKILLGKYQNEKGILPSVIRANAIQTNVITKFIGMNIIKK
jgi:hypothetical protein